MSAEVTSKQLGALARAVSKMADTLAERKSTDPADPDLVFARDYGRNEANGQFEPEYFTVWQQLRREGCTCKPKITRGDAVRSPYGDGRYEVEHQLNCKWIETVAFEERERRRAAQRATKYKPALRAAGLIRGRR